MHRGAKTGSLPGGRSAAPARPAGTLPVGTPPGRCRALRARQPRCRAHRRCRAARPAHSLPSAAQARAGRWHTRVSLGRCRAHRRCRSSRRSLCGTTPGRSRCSPVKKQKKKQPFGTASCASSMTVARARPAGPPSLGRQEWSVQGARTSSRIVRVPLHPVVTLQSAQSAWSASQGLAPDPTLSYQLGAHEFCSQPNTHVAARGLLLTGQTTVC